MYTKRERGTEAGKGKGKKKWNNELERKERDRDGYTKMEEECRKDEGEAGRDIEWKRRRIEEGERKKDILAYN